MNTLPAALYPCSSAYIMILSCVCTCEQSCSWTVRKHYVCQVNTVFLHLTTCLQTVHHSKQTTRSQFFLQTQRMYVRVVLFVFIGDSISFIFLAHTFSQWHSVHATADCSQLVCLSSRFVRSLWQVCWTNNNSIKQFADCWRMSVYKCICGFTFKFCCNKISD